MQIMYMSILNNTKKMFKKKIKNAKTHGNNSYKKMKRKKRKNNTENKKRNRHFKNKTMKNKKMKKILFRVKKKIMDEIEGNIQKGGTIPHTNFDTVAAFWTSGVQVNAAGAAGAAGDAGAAGAAVAAAKHKKNKLLDILGGYKLIQFHL